MKAAASGHDEGPRVCPDEIQMHSQQTGDILHLYINTFCYAWIIKVVAGRISC